MPTETTKLSRTAWGVLAALGVAVGLWQVGAFERVAAGVASSEPSAMEQHGDAAESRNSQMQANGEGNTAPAETTSVGANEMAAPRIEADVEAEEDALQRALEAEAANE